MRNATLSAFATALLLGAPGAANAVLLNGSFESGLTSWATQGQVTIEGTSFGAGPIDGISQVVIGTGGSGIGAATLETNLGLGAGYLDGLLPQINPTTQGDSVVEGSAFQQTFDADPGDILSFDWNFLTNADVRENTTTDFLFLSLSGVDDTVLAHVNQKTKDFTASSTTYNLETGFATTQYTLTAGGSYTLTIGVVDVEDAFTDTAAVIDRIRVRKSPEPSTFLLVAMGLIVLAARRR